VHDPKEQAQMVFTKGSPKAKAFIVLIPHYLQDGHAKTLQNFTTMMKA
jgi:hypothetical protein